MVFKNALIILRSVLKGCVHAILKSYKKKTNEALITTDMYGFLIYILNLLEIANII